jgi:hypothetical protein
LSSEEGEAPEISCSAGCCTKCCDDMGEECTSNSGS